MSSKRKQVVSLLRRAEEALEQARALLDTQDHTCSSCHLVVKENLMEARADEQLAAVVRKLTKLSLQLG